MRLILAPLLLAALCALTSPGCSKPEDPPKVAETCENLASQYLKCVKGTEDPKADALKALEASLIAKCEQLSTIAPALPSCANAPCGKIDACLKSAPPFWHQLCLRVLPFEACAQAIPPTP